MPSDLDQRPYKLYRAGPRGLRALLRGEEDSGVPHPEPPDREPRRGRVPVRWRNRITWRRVLAGLIIAIVAWVLLSLALFLISAGQQSTGIPPSAQAALTSGGNMLTSTDTVLIIGTDERPQGSKEPGANTSDAGSRSDTLMLWRIGGGVSRRLSIPPIASMNFGKAARLTMIRWLILIPVSCSTVSIASAGPPYE